MLKMMEEDKCRFGAAAWASAAPRLEKLCFVLAKETLQHMRATEMCLTRKRSRIREKVRGRHTVPSLRTRGARSRSICWLWKHIVNYVHVSPCFPTFYFTSSFCQQSVWNCKTLSRAILPANVGTRWRRVAAFCKVESVLLSLKKKILNIIFLVSWTINCQ